MTTIRVATFLTAVLFSASLASADDKKPADKPAAAAPAAGAPAAGAPPAMPMPPPELDATFKGYEGNWKCETKFPAGAMGPGSPEMTAKTSVKIKKDKDLAGFWYRGDFEIKKTKTMPGMKGTFYMGVDPGTKQAMLVGIDGMGGTSSGTGPLGETLIFNGSGVMMGQKVTTRETMTKKSDKEVYHKLEVDMGKGLQNMGEDTCKK
jgi:hypothetical protein